MRALQLLTLALLATAAWADTECTIGCTVGAMTFYNVHAPAGFDAQASTGGVDFTNTGSAVPQTGDFGFSVTIPDFWSIAAFLLVAQVADIPTSTFTGVAGGAFAFDRNGNQISGDLDLGNFAFLGPCTDCGLSSNYTAASPLPDIFTVTTISVDETSYGAVDLKQMRFDGRIITTSPEPSAFLLLGSVALIILWLKRHRRLLHKTRVPWRHRP